MDANGLRFWMLADERDWLGDANIAYNPDSRVLALRSSRALPPLPASAADDLRAAAENRLALVPLARDEYDTLAAYDSALNVVVGTGIFDTPVAIVQPPEGANVTCLTMGYDGVLYIATDGSIIMHDRRDRWDNVTLPANGFSAWRIAAAPDGGAWTLDRDNRQIGRVTGLPFPRRPYGPYTANTVRPCDENPCPPRLDVLEDATWPDGETAAAIAASPTGRLVLLTWAADGSALLRLLNDNGAFDAPVTLRDAHFPYSMAWVSDEEVAVLVADLLTEAPVFSVTGGNPVGDFYPTRDHDGGPFLNGVTLPPHYPTSHNGIHASTPLYHLSLPSYASEGEAVNQTMIDSGSPDTAWHRLYLEASIPPNCGIRVYLAATEDPLTPVADSDWHLHTFGDTRRSPFPHGAWMTYPSEVPFHDGLLSCPIQPHRAGLFTALIQRSNRPVRTLRGRFLRVRVVLVGDGRSTPELAALRAYASRFSYVANYLPELYQEDLFPPDADTLLTNGAHSTQADFLERFIDNFEGILTPLEDRIANAYLLTDPRSTPAEALAWLGSWIGVSFEPTASEARRRRMLQAAPELFKYRGTLRGLQIALEIATDGGVSGGEIVVLEDFRLRRTFATILGADLADEENPLLAGLARSGNSYVGDTLFLGDEHQSEFLAVFQDDFERTQEEEDAIAALYDRLAHRVTILVHQEVSPLDIDLIRRVVDLETPAHVLANVITATRGFMVGMAALAGVDTYLVPEPTINPVRIGSGAFSIYRGSQLGLRDLLLGTGSLDPRLGGGPRISLPEPEAPVAHISAPGTVEIGENITLDASGSRAPSDISEYLWTRVAPEE